MPSRAGTRRWIAALALAAVALRALIPAGFMPAPDRLLALEICPDGLRAGMAGQMHHAHEHAGGELAAPGHVPAGSGHSRHGEGQLHLEHCLFGSASAAGPVPHECLHAFVRSAAIVSAAAFTPQRTGGHPAYVPSSRGPPLSG